MTDIKNISAVSLIIVLTLSLFSPACVPTQEGGQVRKNFNPVIPDNLADPSVVMFGDTFYMYATTDINRGLKEMGPPVVWKSLDFVNWSFKGTIIPQIDWNRPYQYIDDEGNTKTGYFRYWAPGKPIKKNGKYYLFPTIVKPDDLMGTYVMIADHPDGPFDFATGSGLCFNEACEDETQPLVADIDGEPFVDDDGEVYLFWRRRHAVKLSDDLLSIEGEGITISTAYGGYSEGPLMFKRNDLYYYIYTLSGHANYCNGYMISRDSPLGPFETPRGESIFIHSNPETGVWGPGHGNVFHMPGTDDYYFLYLEYGEGGTTRQVFANKIAFNDDGTIRPVKPDFRGVGYLIGAVPTSVNLAANATVSASSRRVSQEVGASVIENPNKHKDLKAAGKQAKKIVRTLYYSPEMAVDGSNGTRWYAKKDDDNPWIEFDLGEVKEIDHCEMFFVLPAFGHAWVLEKSLNCEEWEVCGKQSEVAIKSPHLADHIGRARFLRLTITKGVPGLWETIIMSD
jgi:hypothetical protein